MMIRLRNGKVVKAVVLARTLSWMRVAVAGFDDALELRLCGPFWLDERGEPVHFAFTSLFSSGFCWRRIIEPARNMDEHALRLGAPALAESVC